MFQTPASSETRERSKAMEDLNKTGGRADTKISREGIMKQKNLPGVDLRQAVANGSARAVEKPDSRIPFAGLTGVMCVAAQK